jgi:uncharacterized protein YigE (DUF2233 family)
MRKVLLSIVIIIPLLIFGILILKNKSTIPQKSGAQILSASSSPAPTNSIEIDGVTFSWYEIDNLESLKLIPNFTEKLSSQEILNKYNCKFLSNASFYTKENKPTGLFITNNKSLANWQENNLFDGILSINEMKTPRITRDLPKDEMEIAIQTGPILKENNSFQVLKIEKDKESRRVVAGVTGENKLFFMSLYDKNSEFSGPLLSKVPSLLKNFEVKTGIKFADLINLDGGSASVFATSNFQLFEFNPVGAFFCQP